jgi:hypothetical protein
MEKKKRPGKKKTLKYILGREHLSEADAEMINSLVIQVTIIFVNKYE